MTSVELINKMKNDFLTNLNLSDSFLILKDLIYLHYYIARIDIFDYRLLLCLSVKDSNRKQLIEFSNRKRTTIYDRLLKLKKRSVIENYQKKNIPHSRGRPHTYWRLKKNWKESLLDGELYSEALLSLKETREKRKII